MATITDLINDLDTLKTSSIHSIQEVTSIHDLEQLKSSLLGKKSPLSDVLKEVVHLPNDQKPLLGKHANLIKKEFETLLQSKKVALEESALHEALANDQTDITLPAFSQRKGTTHPLTRIQNDLINLFSRLGYSVKEGPDMETDFYNFEALNIPAHHPARDMHDTFYLKSGHVMRTHTSPVQIRTMLAQKPPIKMIAPGKVYRCDADVTHSPVFHQIEGLYVDKHVSFGDLKGTLEYFLRELFGQDKNIRFRSSYFPFTEPSVEVDVEYSDGKTTKWMEIMGAGMVQREVFRHVEIDPDQYSGFAFGLGIERIAMIKYEINDIRLFYENDCRFLNQF